MYINFYVAIQIEKENLFIKKMMCAKQKIYLSQSKTRLKRSDKY
jgi:hypothetical protein